MCTQDTCPRQEAVRLVTLFVQLSVFTTTVLLIGFMTIKIESFSAQPSYSQCIYTLT